MNCAFCGDELTIMEVKGSPIGKKCLLIAQRHYLNICPQCGRKEWVNHDLTLEENQVAFIKTTCFPCINKEHQLLLTGKI